jgi:hypothetical protein
MKIKRKFMCGPVFFGDVLQTIFAEVSNFRQYSIPYLTKATSPQKGAVWKGTSPQLSLCLIPPLPENARRDNAPTTLQSPFSAHCGLP